MHARAAAAAKACTANTNCPLHLVHLAPSAPTRLDERVVGVDVRGKAQRLTLVKRLKGLPVAGGKPAGDAQARAGTAAAPAAAVVAAATSTSSSRTHRRRRRSSSTHFSSPIWLRAASTTFSCAGVMWRPCTARHGTAAGQGRRGVTMGGRAGADAGREHWNGEPWNAERQRQAAGSRWRVAGGSAPPSPSPPEAGRLPCSRRRRSRPALPRTCAGRRGMPLLLRCQGTPGGDRVAGGGGGGGGGGWPVGLGWTNMSRASFRRSQLHLPQGAALHSQGFPPSPLPGCTPAALVRSPQTCRLHVPRWRTHV